MSDGPTVLHVAPHCDDELIGAPATLLALRDRGWRVVNLVCSLGAAGQQQRRRSEVEAACQRARFELDVLEELLGDPLDADEARQGAAAVERGVERLLQREQPALLIAPSPHDRHRGHEVVGRGVLAALATLAGADPAPPLWLWGLWADLPLPTLAVGFDQDYMDEIVEALAAHAGELERNDYRRLVQGRATMNASLGPERVFGFGSAAGQWPYVELLCEVVFHRGQWRAGMPRWLDPARPLAEPGEVDVDAWLTGASVTDRFGPPPLGGHPA